MTFQDRIRELRDAAGLTQAGLSEQTGIPLGTIRDYEQGNREPTLETLMKLAKGLGVSLAVFDPVDIGEPRARVKGKTAPSVKASGKPAAAKRNSGKERTP